MLIRRPVPEVFEAFIDPAITSKFWFTRSTGRLEPGKRVTSTWEMYDVSVDVEVRSIEPNKRIVIEWGNYGEMTTVEWLFMPYEGDKTYVTITNSGFQGDGDTVVKAAIDSTGGVSWGVARAKTLLEHNPQLMRLLVCFLKDSRRVRFSASRRPSEAELVAGVAGTQAHLSDNAS